MPSPFVLLKEYSYKEILISNRKILKCQQNYAFSLCYNVLIFQRWDSSVKSYNLKDFKTLTCRNLYANCYERAIQLYKRGLVPFLNRETTLQPLALKWLDM